MENIINVENLYYNVENFKILENLNFSIKKGEFVSIIGPNGAGKTTLLKCLSDNLSYSGSVKLKEKNIKEYDKKEKAKIISVVPQEYSLPFNFKVIDIIKMGRNPYRNIKYNKSSENNKNLVYRAMIDTNTYELRDRFYNSLSGGEKQRVITARALAQDTDVMYLDEVTSSLDMHHELEIIELIYRINRERGKTVVSIMHDLNMASRFSDRILFLNNGIVVDYNTPEKVFNYDNLSKAYNMEMIIKNNKLLNYKEVIPIRVNRNIKNKTSKIHIICGGGTGEYIIEKLYSEKYQLSCGIIHEGDSDVNVCKSLDIKYITARPFSEFSSKSVEENKNEVEKSDIIVITDVPIGKYNISNLEILKKFKDKKIIILHNSDRDFIEGRADSIIEKIKRWKGTFYAKNLDELFKEIEDYESLNNLQI